MFFILQLTLVWTNFTFEGMNLKTTVTMIIALIYICILVPTFDYVSTAIQEESQSEAKLSYG